MGYPAVITHAQQFFQDLRPVRKGVRKPRGMDVDNVQPIATQLPEGAQHMGPGVIGRGGVGLGRYHHIAAEAFQGLPDVEIGPVHLGGVHHVDAAFQGVADERGAVRRRHTGLKRPQGQCAVDKGRDVKTGIAEGYFSHNSLRIYIN